MEGLGQRSRETGQGCEGTGIKIWEKPGLGHWDQYRCMEGLGLGTVGQGHRGNVESGQWGRNMEYWDRDTGDRDVRGPGQGHKRQGE